MPAGRETCRQLDVPFDIRTAFPLFHTAWYPRSIPSSGIKGTSTLTAVPPLVQLVDRPARLGLPLVPRIDVTLQMIPDVVTDVHLVQVPEFGQFAV